MKALDMRKGKRGRNGGGNAHDRSVAQRRKESNPTLVPSVQTPPPTEALPNAGSRSESKQPSAAERSLLFLEHAWVLLVLGAVIGLVGVFIDGRYFLFLCVPIALGLHRSQALKDLGRARSLGTYVLVLALSSAILWIVGAATNNSREHIPSADEIAKRVMELLESNKKSGVAADAPRSNPLPTPPPSPTTLPATSPDLPTLGFQDDSDTVSVTFGTNTGSNRIGFLKKMSQAVFPITVDGFSPVSFKWDKDHISYGIKFWSPDQRSAVEVTDGRFVLRNIGLDRNFTKNAFEVVASNGQPVLQVIWVTPGHMRLNGLFPRPDDQLLCIANDLPRAIPIDKANGCDIKPLFRYPSWKYPGEFAEP